MAKSKVRIVERKKFVNAMDVPKVSHALEDYLKAIYQLGEESQPVIAARIAAETGVLRPLYLRRCSAWRGKAMSQSIVARRSC